LRILAIHRSSKINCPARLAPIAASRSRRLLAGNEPERHHPGVLQCGCLRRGRNGVGNILCLRVQGTILRCLRNRLCPDARSHVYAVLEPETQGTDGLRCRRRGRRDTCGGDNYQFFVVGGSRGGEHWGLPSEGTSSRSHPGIEDHRRRVADFDSGVCSHRLSALHSALSRRFKQSI
ncbi:unnamed protein product, partial [Ectocarpus sp. 12 AP-2014]